MECEEIPSNVSPTTAGMTLLQVVVHCPTFIATPVQIVRSLLAFPRELQRQHCLMSPKNLQEMS